MEENRIECLERSREERIRSMLEVDIMSPFRRRRFSGKHANLSHRGSSMPLKTWAWEEKRNGVLIKWGSGGSSAPMIGGAGIPRIGRRATFGRRSFDAQLGGESRGDFCLVGLSTRLRIRVEKLEENALGEEGGYLAI